MPRVSNELTAQYWEPMAIGPVAQADLTASIALPASLAAGAVFTSPPIYADGYKAIAVGVTLSVETSEPSPAPEVGTLTVQRFLDAAGLVPQASPAPLALQAGQPATLNITDGLPFQSFTVSIANSSAAAAYPTNFALLLNAA